MKALVNGTRIYFRYPIKKDLHFMNWQFLSHMQHLCHFEATRCYQCLGFRSCSVGRLHPVTHALFEKGCSSAFTVVSPINIVFAMRGCPFAIHFLQEQPQKAGPNMWSDPWDYSEVLQLSDLRSRPGICREQWYEVRFRRRVIGLM